jgi:hypothetical protein
MTETATDTGVIEITGIKEVCHTTVFPDNREAVGLHVEFTDDLFDAEGNKIGTAEGVGVLFANSAGELMQLFSATDNLTDGSIAWTGACPHDPANLTQEHSVLAVGTSGRYLGKVGTRYFTFVSRPDESTTILSSRISLHGEEAP